VGIFNFIKNQFIEVIEWTDSTIDTIVYRFPVENKEIKMGASLTVRESQTAIFINEGQVADVFPPGRYTLSTENMPVLTKLKSWMYGFNSPFKAEVYFVNTKQFTDQKWGTINPVMMRDTDFGAIRIRAFGNFSFRVVDAVRFMQEIFGTNHSLEVDDITGQLKRAIVSTFADAIAESKIAALDLAAYYDELGQQTRTKMIQQFEAYGLAISSVIVENISLPEEVEKALDNRTKMGIYGGQNNFERVQMVDAVGKAAENPSGGMAGMGVGIGVAAALGNMMGNMFNGQLQQSDSASTNVYFSSSSKTSDFKMTINCSKCQNEIPMSSKFCPHCGNVIAIEKVSCVNCHSLIKKGAKFCPECGSPQATEKTCAKCGTKLSTTAKFCLECGTAT